MTTNHHPKPGQNPNPIDVSPLANNQPDELNELFDLAVEAKDNLRGAESASEVRYGDEQLAEAKHRLNALIDKKVRETGHWYKGRVDRSTAPEHRGYRSEVFHLCNCGFESHDKFEVEGHVKWKLAQLQNNQPKRGKYE